MNLFDIKAINTLKLFCNDLVFNTTLMKDTETCLAIDDQFVLITRMTLKAISDSFKPSFSGRFKCDISEKK